MNDNTYCTIYLVRHGESEANAKNLYGLDTGLTEKGREQVRALLKTLKGVCFDAAFTSPLIRAKETVEIIALEHQLIVVTKKAFTERFSGELEGKTQAEIKSILKKRDDLRKTLPYKESKKLSIAEGYETDEELMERVITELREIAVAYAGKTVLIGSHYGLMRTLLAHLGFKTFKELVGFKLTNAAFIKLRSDGVDFLVDEVHGLEQDEK